MKPRKCPKCSGSLKPVNYAQIEVDRCVKCQGIWFDSLEAETLKEIEGSEILDTGNPEAGNKLDRLDGDICCPRCGKKMMRMLDIDQHSIWYEKCLNCHGVWLDAGEFRKFKDNFQGKGLVNRVKGMFRR